MKRASVVGITFTMFLVCVIVVSSSVAALTISAEHSDAFGQTLVEIDGHPVFRIDGYHYDSGSAPFEPYSVIRIWRYSPAVSRWVVVGYITDGPSGVSRAQIVYAGFPTSIQLVDSGTIDARREGNSKTIMVVWNEALEVPAEHWGPPSPGGITFPAMTIPPGRLIFRGHGDSFTSSTTTNSVPPGTWTQTVTGTYYYGNATFVNPTWDFGGPVGVNEGTNRTLIRTDGTVTTTIY